MDPPRRMTTAKQRNRYLLILFGIFGAIAAWAAIAPMDRGAWALENSLVVVGLAVLFFSYRTLPLSRASYTLIFLFLCLHEIGSHYTYAGVPYGDWLRSLFGSTLAEELGSDRNHYDRIVHFFYGLLLAYPIREVVLRVGDMKGFWGYFLPLDVTMSTSLIYELLEWGAAMVFSGNTGMQYLATQGDEWDTQKDMLLASSGAFLAMSITALINWRMQRDFAREWNQSLRVKHPRPLGEEALVRMSKQKNGKGI